MAINEAQGLDWKRIAASFKASAESMVADRRGRADQSMDRYMSRLVVLMTSNAAPPLTPTELVRLILIHMDEGAKVERERARAAFEAAAAGVRGRAIGPELARLIVRHTPRWRPSWPGAPSSLSGSAPKPSTNSFRSTTARAPVRAADVYLGLEAFDLACRENAVDCTLPDVHRFMREIIIPIERGAAEGEITALQSLRSFTANFRVEHTVRQVEETERGVVLGLRDSVKGEGAIIFSDALDLNEGREGAVPRRIPGTRTTHPFLDRFNQECDRRSRPELRFASLKELSERSAIEAGLPREAFLEFDKKRGTWRDRRPAFPDRSRPRAAFVPAAEGRLEGILDAFVDGVPPGPGPSGSGDKSEGENGIVPDVDSPGPTVASVGPVGSGGSHWVRMGPDGSGWVCEISDVKPPLRTPGPTFGAGPTNRGRGPRAVSAPSPGPAPLEDLLRRVALALGFRHAGPGDVRTLARASSGPLRAARARFPSRRFHARRSPWPLGGVSERPVASHCSVGVRCRCAGATLDLPDHSFPGPSPRTGGYSSGPTRD